MAKVRNVDDERRIDRLKLYVSSTGFRCSSGGGCQMVVPQRALDKFRRKYGITEARGFVGDKEAC